MKNYVLILLFSMPIASAPYTEGIDLNLESDIADADYSVKLVKHSSSSGKGSIENEASLKGGKKISRGMFEKLEFTMPATSSAAELHSTEVVFDVKRNNAFLGTCTYVINLNLAWTGFGSRKAVFSETKILPHGKVACDVATGANEITFKVNKEATQNRPQKATTFSVLSFNVQMRTGLDLNEWKGPLISMRLNPYDIVGVQENFANVAGLMSKLEHISKFHFSKKWPTALYNSGLAIFSKYKMLETKGELFKDVAAGGLSFDWAASKGVVLARLDINGAIVDVYNTHMHAGDSVRENNARIGQVAQLLKFIDTNSPPANSVILMGDFNMSPKRDVKSRKELQPGVHYSDDSDMLRRTTAFQTLIDRSGLIDVIDHLKQDTKDFEDCKVKYEKETKKPMPSGDDTRCLIMRDEIDRILYRPGSGHQLKLLNIRKDSFQFLDGSGKELSDGNPNVVTFEIGKK